MGSEHEAAGLLEEMDFVADKREGGEDAADAGHDEPVVARGARVKEAKAGEDQRNRDPGEDDHLMERFEGHGYWRSIFMVSGCSQS